jgi:hypothetical protein
VKVRNTSLVGTARAEIELATIMQTKAVRNIRLRWFTFEIVFMSFSFNVRLVLRLALPRGKVARGKIPAQPIGLC